MTCRNHFFRLALLGWRFLAVAFGRSGFLAELVDGIHHANRLHGAERAGSERKV